MAFLRYPEGREPDYDRSGVIDRSDLDILVEARNQPAGPGDPRDLDRDGGITALDARKLVLRCDYSRCASGLPPRSEPEVFFIHTDQLGTPRLLSNRDQAIVWRWDSDPFGTTPASEDPDGDGQPLVYNGRFPGQYFDGETGLYYNYFRDYDPSTGRYIQSDPIGLDGGLNTYTYAGSNPLSYTDHLGLIYFPNGKHGLPRTDSCKPSEWSHCEGKCPYGVDGCYVTLKWRIKGVRGGNLIRVEERIVNCNCKEPPCKESNTWWEPIIPILPFIPIFTPWPDPY